MRLAMEPGRAYSDMTDSTEQTDPVELAVILTTYNRAHLIDESLAALAEQEWGSGTWEIVLVDNNSTDHTGKVLDRWAEKMPVPARVVEATAGQGPSFARNAGVRATRARSVAFVDDDDMLAADWVATIGRSLRLNTVVASRHEFERLNDPILAATRTNQTVGLGSFHGVPVVSGGGLGCHREIWEGVGGSNPDFRTGQDIDFSLRLERLGRATPTFCADAVYHPRLRTGVRAAFEQGERFGRSWVRLHKVHGELVEYQRLPLRRWLRRWVALGLRMKKLTISTQRLRWGFDIGYELGRIRGTIVYRTWAAE